MNAHSRRSVSVLRMTAPLVVSFWMRAAVTFVDTIYAALIGDAPIAAIGLTIPFEFVMIALWVGISTGLTSRLSRAMGERKEAQFQQYIACAWKLVWIVSPVFTVLGGAIWFVAPFMDLSPEVQRHFQVYGTVLVAGSAFTTFWSIIPDSLVKAHQDTRSTMWAGIWSNLINLALNTLFLFVFGWGVFGIALSTVLGRIGGLVYALIRARAHEECRKAEIHEWDHDLDPTPFRSIFGLAFPSSLTFILMATETALINLLLSRSPHSTEAIAAYSIYYRIVLFALQPVIAGAVALLPYGALRVGAGDYAGVRSGFRQVNLAAVIYSLLLVAPVTIAAAPWLSRQLAESAITAEYTRIALYAVPLSCLASTAFLLCRPVFEAMNRGRPGLIMATARYVILTAPLALIGMGVARRISQPEIYGLIAGTILASALASITFYAWLAATIPRESPDAPG